MRFVHAGRTPQVGRATVACSNDTFRGNRYFAYLFYFSQNPEFTIFHRILSLLYALRDPYFEDEARRRDRSSSRFDASFFFFFFFFFRRSRSSGVSSFSLLPPPRWLELLRLLSRRSRRSSPPSARDVEERRAELLLFDRLRPAVLLFAGRASTGASAASE